jgi:hypothetical protein
MAAKRAGAGSGTRTREDILAALREAPLSTTALADQLAQVRARVYSRCRRLEAKGLLKSHLASAGLLLYCVDDRRVVTGADYQTCKDEGHDLRAFDNEERIWSLPAGK